MAKKPRGPLVIGVDIGGTNVLAGVVDGADTLVGRAKKKTKAERGAEEVVDRIAACVQEALKDAGAEAGDVGGLCVGAPGPLDPEGGVVISAPNLGWRDVPLKAQLEGMLGIPTRLDNDVNVGTYGEFALGAGRGANDLIGIFVGTGIGGGLVLGGQLHYGFNRTAGEIGHLVVAQNGPLCGCGNRGCLEAIAGRAGMMREILYQVERGRPTVLSKLTKGEIEDARSRTLTEAYEAGDPLVVEVVRRGVEALGAAIGSVVNLLSPEAIVLGGGFATAMGKDYVKAVEEASARNAFPQCIRGVRFALAELGDDAGVLGAARLARESLATDAAPAGRS